jgi:HAD superfamily hydrolase (TIGR01509 family)
VIFDMDGVLADSEALICAAAMAMFAEKGLRVRAEDFRPFVGTGEERYLGGVAERYHFKLDLPSAKRRIYEIYLAMVPTDLAAFPGAPELVHRCRRAGLRLALASSADEIKIVANLRKINLPLESWDAVVSGELVKAKKPAPDLFLAAAARLGARPEQCAVVEDAVNGVAAAKAAGMRCIGVAQTFSARELEGADLVRQKIADVTLADLLGATLGKGTALTPAEGAGPHPRLAPE